MKQTDRTALREPDAGNPHVRFDEGATWRSLAFAPFIPRVHLLYERRGSRKPRG